MSVLTVSDPSRDLHPVRSADRTAGTVLAVVAEYCSLSQLVLERAASLASELAASLRVVMIYRPVGFSTDPALVSHARLRREHRLAELLAAGHHLWRPDQSPVTMLVPAARPPWRRSTAQAWRAIERTAGSCTASRVVAPACLVPPSVQRTSPTGQDVLVVVEAAAHHRCGSSAHSRA